jgi:hypothetical protein
MLLVSLTAAGKKIRGDAFTNSLKTDRGNRKNDPKEGSE